MWLKFQIATIFLIAAGSAAAGHLDVFHSPSKYNAECESDGYKCLSCDKSQYCFNIGGGIWINETIVCPEQQICHDDTGECAPGLSESCGQNYLPKCHQAGLFPHAYDCTKYYACKSGELSEVPIMMDCIEGFKYDPLTTICDILIEPNDDCQIMDNYCNYGGQNGSILNNPHMFYICVTELVDENSFLNPYIRYCENGERFDKTLKKCREARIPPLDNEGTCTSTGKYYDADDCKKYYDCVVNKQPENEDCEPNNYFDKWTQECVTYPCPY